jgi:hypothetical protein
MFEELGYHCLGKLVLVKNNEGVALFRPSNQVCVSRLLQEAIESCQRCSESNRGSVSGLWAITKN